ncbi:probable RNA-binding protein 46 isoform X4 [Lethenteron reissneri]|uniref:probable RNA-binding protein 46 isoform X4 n=1 Tax=Lethenteron reissneri TaxID=7753 RepID=UPI002AB7063A|nr:probable RNA-binding protein 46 isoform X4 [Lethenteron reissneri]
MFVAVAIQTDREKTAEQAAISQSQRGGVSRDAGPANGVTPSTGLGSKSTRRFVCLTRPPAAAEYLEFASLSHQHRNGEGTVTTSRGVQEELVRRTGYRLAQENGQRTYGPPPDWKGFPPPRGSEVFVGKLPRDLYEDELVPVLEMVGQLYKLRLMMAFSGENRGFAFATYTNCADAETAVRKLNNWYIRPRHRIGVCISKDNCCIFISGLPKDKTKEEVLMEMCCATEGVVDVKMSSYAQSQGYALVEYQNHRAAAMARRRMIPVSFQLWCHPICVEWADPDWDVATLMDRPAPSLHGRHMLLPARMDLRACGVLSRNNSSDGGGTSAAASDEDFARWLCSAEVRLAKGCENHLPSAAQVQSARGTGGGAVCNNYSGDVPRFPHCISDQHYRASELWGTYTKP